MSPKKITRKTSRKVAGSAGVSKKTTEKPKAKKTSPPKKAKASPSSRASKKRPAASKADVSARPTKKPASARTAPKKAVKKSAKKSVSKKTVAGKSAPSAASKKVTAKPRQTAKSAVKKTIRKSSSKVASKPASTKATPVKQAEKRIAPKKTSAAKKAVGKKTSSGKLVAEKGANGAPALQQTAKSLSGVAPASAPLRPSRNVPIVGQDVEKFRTKLIEIRRRLRGDVSMMSREALGGSDSGADNHAPIHPAEIGTHSFEQEFTLNLLSSDGDRLESIEAALEKIAENSYGLCDECGKRIPKARLEVIPDTPYCVDCASKLEG